jgi:hypothetical protein
VATHGLTPLGIRTAHSCPFPCRCQDPAPRAALIQVKLNSAVHIGTPVRTTETVYRYELRPVITTGADVRDKIFTTAQREDSQLISLTESVNICSVRHPAPRGPGFPLANPQPQPGYAEVMTEPEA